MTPMNRRQPGLMGPDVAMVPPPAPLQFAPMAPMPTATDATGAQAIGGLANLTTALMNRPQGGVGGAGGAMGRATGGGPTDAPRRKTPFTQAASYA